MINKVCKNLVLVYLYMIFHEQGLYLLCLLPKTLVSSNPYTQASWADLGQSQPTETKLAGRGHQTPLKRNTRKFPCNWAMTLRLVNDLTYLCLFPKLTRLIRNAVSCLLPPRQVTTVSRDHWWLCPAHKPALMDLTCHWGWRVFSESHISTQRSSHLQPVLNMFGFILSAHKPESSMYLKL